MKNISANGVLICNRENQQNLQKSLIERLTNTVLRCFLVKKTNFGDHKVDLQIKKGEIKNIKMKFFKDPNKWKQEISEIGLTAGFMLFLFSFLVMGNPSIWLLFSCIPLLVPLIFGSRLKMKLPALLLIVISAGIIGSTIYRQRRPINLNSPNGKNIAILYRRGNNNCYTVKIDGQFFYTKVLIGHISTCDWQGNDCFILKSSAGGNIEFRKENGVWKASPESLIRKNEG